MLGRCCGWNPRFFFLMGSAMIEYMAHAIVLLLSPLIVVHFYPQTSIFRIALFTSLLSSSGYLGHCLSSRSWINIARTLKSSKGVILWGLSVIAMGNFGFLLCQGFWAMVLVRFAMGLFSGVTPVAMIEIDNFCGQRQSHIARSTKYMAICLACIVTSAMVRLGERFLVAGSGIHNNGNGSGVKTNSGGNATFPVATLVPASFTGERVNKSTLYLYPLAFVSILAWIAVIAILVGLRMKSRASYMQVAREDDPQGHQASTSLEAPTPQNRGGPHGAGQSLALVTSAIKETFGGGRSEAKHVLNGPRPHFQVIRDILPHYFHGFNKQGDLMFWDFVGRMKMDRLVACGFTTSDLKSHYVFLLHFAMEKLLHQHQTIIYIVDLEGLTLTDTNERILDTTLTIVKEIQRKFPDKLEMVLVLNAPAWFSQVMNEIRPHLSQKHVEKVCFLRKENAADRLIELIGADNLPRQYGGNNEVAFGQSQQEKLLEELLLKTTGPLERTKEIIGGKTARQDHAIMIGASDEESDEEAFFDCSEYGLQEEAMDDVELAKRSTDSLNSSVSTSRRRSNSWELESGLSRSASTNSTSMQAQASHTKATSAKTHGHGHGRGKGHRHTIASPREADLSRTDGDACKLILSESQACMILAFFFFWSIVQIAFDEVLPIWLLSREFKSAEKSNLEDSICSIVIEISIMLACVAGLFCVSQLCFCTLSSNLMTPLATLRVGLLLQFPIVGALPLIDALELSIAPLLVIIVVLFKHLASAIAGQGLLSLLDNSIEVDRRLIAHRAAHVVYYTAFFWGSGVLGAVFALLVYLKKPFPLDTSLFFFFQAVALVALFFLSFVIPTRLNFPLLFTMGKR